MLQVVWCIQWHPVNREEGSMDIDTNTALDNFEPTSEYLPWYNVIWATTFTTSTSYSIPIICRSQVYIGFVCEELMLPVVDKSLCVVSNEPYIVHCGKHSLTCQTRFMEFESYNEICIFLSGWMLEVFGIKLLLQYNVQFLQRNQQILHLL